LVHLPGSPNKGKAKTIFSLLDKKSPAEGLIIELFNFEPIQLDELYDLYGDVLYRYLILRLGSAQHAEDILQAFRAIGVINCVSSNKPASQYRYG
jgi:hypothetical protein